VNIFGAQDTTTDIHQPPCEVLGKIRKRRKINRGGKFENENLLKRLRHSRRI